VNSAFVIIDVTVIFNGLDAIFIKNAKIILKGCKHNAHSLRSSDY
jgi:hypothetical protein